MVWVRLREAMSEGEGNRLWNWLQGKAFLPVIMRQRGKSPEPSQGLHLQCPSSPSLSCSGMASPAGGLQGQTSRTQSQAEKVWQRRETVQTEPPAQWSFTHVGTSSSKWHMQSMWHSGSRSGIWTNSTHSISVLIRPLALYTFHKPSHIFLLKSPWSPRQLNINSGGAWGPNHK